MSDTSSWLAEDDRDALAAVLDVVIPESADGRLPGAGSLGLAAPIAEALSESREIVLGGLRAVAERAGASGGAFADLPDSQRGDVLNEVSAAEPAFLPSLIFHVYVHYYRHPQVLVALGLEGRPPYPKGYEISENDLGLLDPVRERPKLYRDV